MQILYFYQYFTTPKGSWGTRVYEFARRWVAQGDTVTIVTSVYDKSDLKPGRFLDSFEIDGIRVIVINVRLSNKHGVLLRLFTFAAYAVVACWYALRLPADVVVSSSGPITVGLPGLVARLVRGRPFVFEVRDLWPEGAIQLGILRNSFAVRLARAFERTCYRFAHRIVALSPGMSEWIQRTYGCSHVSVVPNAADSALFDQVRDSFQMPAWAVDRTIVFYGGTLGLIDDCGQILDAAKVMRDSHPGYLFVIAGDGKQRAMLQERAEQQGLSNVRFLGLRSKEEVLQWLSVASCALFTCKDVAFLNTASPNKLFDAFAAGVPVVQTSQGWIRELVQREGCGISVPPNDAAALAGAIALIGAEPAVRERLAANARRLGRGPFDREFLSAAMHEAIVSATLTPPNRALPVLTQR